MASSVVDILSRRMVRPSPRDEEAARRFDLTPWDLKMLSVDYIQKGILFEKQGDHHDLSTIIISGLLSSFSRAIDHFFPLAGRLATVNHDTAPPSLSIFLDCNDDGAEFIHASAPDITVSGILTPLYTPPVVNAFFPLNGVIGIDGHSSPLLAVQVTQLADGIFIACSLNHAVADGTTFWHFFNSWSEISRTGIHVIPNPPVLDRWFLDSCPPPIHLPYSHHHEFIRRPNYNYGPVQLKECFFHFSARSIARLKAKANAEAGTDRLISSLQSLLAHVWRSVTRARGLEPQQETNYMVFVGCRSRMNPPLPQTYIGNSIMGVSTAATAGEVVEQGVGRAAWRLNQTVASQSDAAARGMLESWTRSPSFIYVDQFSPYGLTSGSSPRFNVYGNDFGWGRPVAVRSGCGNKLDGKVTVYPGPEEGSMALEVCISAGALSVLVEDKEFMEAVG